MCGLFGIAGPGIQMKDIEIFKDLGIVSQVRGLDGSGVYQVKANPTYNNNDFSAIFKSESTFAECLFEIDYTKKKKSSSNLLESIAVDFIMGHVRAATRGLISDENAHPFELSNLVGAHNGTLRDKKYEDKNKTDSELMYRDISSRGIIEVLKDMDKNSAYAITMFDKVNRKVYMVRNEKRTLHFALNDSRSVLYWASEPEILRFVLRRQKQEFFAFGIPAGVLWEFKPSDIPTGTTFKNNNKPFIKVIHNFNPPVIVTEVVENKDVKEAPFDGGQVKKEETKEEPKGKVVQFPLNNFRAFYSKCMCGKETLNLLRADLCRKGKLKGYTFDSSSNSYYCTNCVKEEKHAVH